MGRVLVIALFCLPTRHKKNLDHIRPPKSTTWSEIVDGLIKEWNSTAQIGSPKLPRLHGVLIFLLRLSLPWPLNSPYSRGEPWSRLSRTMLREWTRWPRSRIAPLSALSGVLSVGPHSRSNTSKNASLISCGFFLSKNFQLPNMRTAGSSRRSRWLRVGRRPRAQIQYTLGVVDMVVCPTTQATSAKC